MKQIAYTFSILAFLFNNQPANSISVPNQFKPENNSGSILCVPAAYLQAPDDCIPLGPSKYITDLATEGFDYPLKPLQVSHPDQSLMDLPYHYYKVNNTGTSFYPSPQAACSKKGAVSVLPPGAFFYVVYAQRFDIPKCTYFQLPSGLFMPGDGSTVSISNNFPGVEVKSNPTIPFGFVFNSTAIRSQPNESSDTNIVGKLVSYQIVPIYETKMIDTNVWHSIGPDQWVTGRDIALVTPNPIPPAGVNNNRWIDVDLSEQTLAVYENSQMIFATVVATGLDPLFTRPGLFHIYKKKELETMRGENKTPNFYYLENVPWTMYFDKARALHGAYWRARLGYPQSHGCVNLFPGDAHWLYNWANEGDFVYIHDPSGKTPTDPSLYGDGGA